MFSNDYKAKATVRTKSKSFSLVFSLCIYLRIMAVEIKMVDYEYVPMETDNGDVVLKKIGEECYMQVAATREIIEFYNIPKPSTWIMKDCTNEHPGTSSNNFTSYDQHFYAKEQFDTGFGHGSDGSEHAPDDALPEADQDEADEGGNAASSFRWSREHVLAFLTLYEDKQCLLRNGKLSRKKFFDSIAADLRLQGFDVTGNQCKTKIDSLKRQYKSVKDHNNKSGNDRRDWQYLVRMDELFGKKPWVQPLSIASSSDDKSCSEAEALGKSSSSPGKKLTPTKNKRLLDLLTTMRETKEKQHKERMEQRKEALKLMEMLVQALSNKK